MNEPRFQLRRLSPALLLPILYFAPYLPHPWIFPASPSPSPSSSSSRGGAQSVSVVIPAYHEPGLATSVRRVHERAVGKVEVIVVDAGGVEVEAVRAAGARVVDAGGMGRGRALNAGAAVAGGEVVVFLHADTELPVGFDEVVLREFGGEEKEAMMTAFTFAIQGEKKVGLRGIEWSANWRARVLRLPYGDQAIAMRREVFWERFGGFKDDHVIMEDIDLVWRVRDECLRMGGIRGCKKGLVILPEKAHCSSRRWEQKGVIKNTVLNWVFVAIFRAGVSPTTIYNLYYGRSSKL